MEFKGKEERKQCYNARDAYFECYESYPPDKKDMAKEACKKLYDKFEQLCGAKWTEHFVRRHDYLKFKAKMLSEGPEAVDAQKFKSSK